MPMLQPSLMEVTGALTSAARRANFSFGDDTALITVQHMLLQTVDLFRAVGVLGLAPQNIFALGKIYSNSETVIQTLRNMGVTVLDGILPGPGEFDECFANDVRRLCDHAAQRMAGRLIRRIIVLDDGGACISNFPANLLRQYVVVGVEQTSRGMFAFEKKPPPYAVISWARTAVKLHIGGPIFSQCLLEKLNDEFLGRKLRGAEVGILGMGSIGRGLANLVRRPGNDVMFFDPDPGFQLPRYLHNDFTRVNSLEELMLGCDYVFGCSGRNPFKDRWPMAHRPGIKLFSASGGDHEFGPIIQQIKHGPGFKMAGDSLDLTGEGPCGVIRIAYMGYPYNFVSRAPEAVPTRIVQLETGGLLASLIQARNYLRLCESGEEQNSGIHRLAPTAQHFVFEKWLETMAERHIDIRKIYDYDEAMLEDATHSCWFIDNTEPNSRTGYNASSRVEESMNCIVNPGNRFKFLVRGQS